MLHHHSVERYSGYIRVEWQKMIGGNLNCKMGKETREMREEKRDARLCLLKDNKYLSIEMHAFKSIFHFY
jgi:hypothetical protein